MRKSPIESVYVGRIDLPAPLAEEVKALLRDPVTRRTRYGDLRRLTIMLFTNWVDSQRLRPQGGPHGRYLSRSDDPKIITDF